MHLGIDIEPSDEYQLNQGQYYEIPSKAPRLSDEKHARADPQAIGPSQELYRRQTVRSVPLPQEHKRREYL